MGVEEGSTLVKVCVLFKKSSCISQGSQLPRVLWDTGFILEIRLCTNLGRTEEVSLVEAVRGSEERSLNSPSGTLAKEDRPKPAGKCKKPIQAAMKRKPQGGIVGRSRAIYCFFFFLRLFIWEREHKWGEKQTPWWIGSPTWGSILGPQCHNLSWKQHLTNWAIQVPQLTAL